MGAVKRLAAALAAAVVLAGCAKELNHGVVTGKDFFPGYMSTTMMCSDKYKVGDKYP